MIFIVPGKIYSKARPYTTTNKYTGKVHTFSRKNTVYYEDLVKQSFNSCKDKTYFGNKDLSITINCYFKIPKSYSKKKRQECLDGIHLPHKTPDIDNVTKIVCDALNKLAYIDDRQLITGLVNKRWSSDEEYLTVEIKEIEL